MSINRGMDKEDLVLIKIYNGILLTHKRNKIGSFVETYMELETVIQSEVTKINIIFNVYMWNLEK